MTDAFPATSATVRCPECGQPNGWHAWVCVTGIALVNSAFELAFEQRAKTRPVEEPPHD